jgi:hypothetical protein
VRSSKKRWLDQTKYAARNLRRVKTCPPAFAPAFFAHFFRISFRPRKNCRHRAKAHCGKPRRAVALYFARPCGGRS